MRDIFNFLVRFLTLNDQNMIPEVVVCVLAVWAAILVVTVMSILSQPLSGGAKAAWMMLAFALPPAGVAIYAIYCITRQDFGFLRIFGQGNRAKKRLAHGK